MSAPFTGTLAIVDGQVSCQNCGHALGPAGEPWKPNATMKERPMQGAGGTAYASADHVVLRQFFCPSCAALLDSETAMADDPFLNDVIG